MLFSILFDNLIYFSKLGVDNRRKELKFLTVNYDILIREVVSQFYIFLNSSVGRARDC